MFWLNLSQIAYIAKLIVFLSLCPLLFPVVLEQNLILSQESLLIFYIPNESISELKVNRKMQCVWLNLCQIAYIAKLIVFLSLCPLFFPVVLEQNLILSQESLLIFYIPNESISELKVNREMQGVLLA